MTNEWVISDFLGLGPGYPVHMNAETGEGKAWRRLWLTVYEDGEWVCTEYRPGGPGFAHQEWHAAADGSDFLEDGFGRGEVEAKLRQMIDLAGL